MDTDLSDSAFDMDNDSEGYEPAPVSCSFDPKYKYHFTGGDARKDSS